MAGNHKGGGIKHLLLAHCEKVIALGIVLMAGYLVYASMTVEGISKTKNELSQLVSRTKSAYEQSTWEQSPPGSLMVTHPVASADIANLPSGPYRKIGGFARPVVPPTVDRTDPALLAPTGLEGRAITGIFAFESEEEARRRQLEQRRKEEARLREQEKARESGDEQILGGGYGGELGGRGGEESVDELGRKIRPIAGQTRKEGVPTTGMERFRTLSAACVMAKAPIAEQFKLYQAALEEARGYSESTDIPRYLGLYVERAEVRDEEEELEWKPIKFGSLAGGRQYPVLASVSWDKMVADWIPWPEPMVDNRYEHPVLTMPLPPLVQQSWGPKFVHSDAPLQVDSDAQAALEEANTVEGEDEEEEAEDADIFTRGRRERGVEGRGRGRGRTGIGGRGGRGGGEYGGFGGGGEYGGGGGEYGGFGGGGEYGGGGGGGGRGYSSRSSGGEYAFDPEIEFAMIRIWDFSVASGRQYRYRVKLVLEDVNRNALASSLAPEVTARLDSEKGPRTTEWSEPSPILSVPMAGDVFVSSAKLPSGRQKNAEGTIELLVQSYSLDENRRAIKGGVKESFRRGSVVNLVEDAWVGSPDGRIQIEIDSFKFNTGLTLVDYEGGEEIGGKLKAPVAVLLMDASGRLITRNELDDHATVRSHEVTFEETGGSAYGGGYGGGEFGGGEFRGR